MKIEQTDSVDFVTFTDAGEVLLTISDHLLWDEQGHHLLLLQEKLNAYLRFIEGGDLGRKFPQSRGRSVVMNVVMKHHPTQQGVNFIKKAQEKLAAAGFKLRTEVLRPN